MYIKQIRKVLFNINHRYGLFATVSKPPTSEDLVRDAFSELCPAEDSDVTMQAIKVKSSLLTGLIYYSV